MKTASEAVLFCNEVIDKPDLQSKNNGYTGLKREFFSFMTEKMHTNKRAN